MLSQPFSAEVSEGIVGPDEHKGGGYVQGVILQVSEDQQRQSEGE